MTLYLFNTKVIKTNETMRNTLFLLVPLFIVLFGCNTAPENEEQKTSETESISDEFLVKQLIVNSFDEVWSNLDTNKVSDFHTDDFILLENGVIWNNDSILNYQKNELARMQEYGYERKNKFEFIKVEESEESIWVAYDNFATWISDDEITSRAHWVESAVAVKTADGWRLQMLHSTPVNH